MLRKNSVKVRAESGPSRPRSPNCATPAASEANTSGITTKNSSRRKIWPMGSKTFVATQRAPSSTAGEPAPMSSVSAPAMAPPASPSRMRLASLASTPAAMSATRPDDHFLPASGLLRKP